MDKNMNFIRTTDKETAEQLKAAGLILLSETPSAWTFANNKEFYEDKFTQRKFQYTNLLSV